MLRANFHTHTTLCDGSDTPQAVAAEAYRKGFLHLGFSGHLEQDIQMDFAEYSRQIRALQREYAGRMDILFGVELDRLYDPANAAGVEYLIGSTHYLPLEEGHAWAVDNSPEMITEMGERFYGGDYYAMARDYFELEAGVYDATHCDFVGHFDLIVRFNDQLHFLDESDPRYTRPALEAMEYLVREGVPFEINCGAVNRGRKADFYPNTFFLKHLHDFGAEIFINSDAHQKELLDGAFPEAVAQAIACGFTHTNILAHDEDGKVRVHQLALDALY